MVIERVMVGDAVYRVTQATSERLQHDDGPTFEIEDAELNDVGSFVLLRSEKGEQQAVLPEEGAGDPALVEAVAAAFLRMNRAPRVN